jgi:hypothetical protein
MCLYNTPSYFRQNGFAFDFCNYLTGWKQSNDYAKKFTDNLSSGQEKNSEIFKSKWKVRRMPHGRRADGVLPEFNVFLFEFKWFAL